MARTHAARAATQPAIGTLLQYWRKTRNMSQLALAHEAAVSPRHVCFLETGRAKPSREMVLRLADTLSVPLRDRNALLTAAPSSWRTLDASVALLPVLPVSFRHGELRLDFFSAVTVLGTPQDVTLQELRIESFFPVDAATAAVAHRLAAEASDRLPPPDPARVRPLGRRPGLGDPKEREQVLLRIKALKVELQVLETERLRLATQEADATNQLALEQNTWSDLNRSLDELEKSLTQPRKQ